MRSGVRVLTVVSMLLAAPATAQDMMPLPRENSATVQDSDEFRRCRVAVLWERSAQSKTTIPPEVVAVMEEQIAFIMSDTIFNLPSLSVSDGLNRLQFIEEWYIDFGRDVREGAGPMADPAVRGAALLHCQTILWRIILGHIETLVAWRARAMGATDAPRIDFGVGE